MHPVVPEVEIICNCIKQHTSVFVPFFPCRCNQSEGWDDCCGA